MNNFESSHSRSRPAWYYRVLRLSLQWHHDLDDYGDVKPGDFDEDISELGESDKEDESEAYCDCDSDASECDCEPPVDDHVSERSYTEDDADYYYELKEMRKDRKRVLRDLKEQEAKIKEQEATMKELEARVKQEERKHSEGKINEVREAYKKLKQVIQNGDEPPILDPLAMISRFHLFSVEHVDYCCHGDIYPTRFVSFCHLSELIQVANGATSKDSTDDNPKPLYGDVYLGAKTDCEIDRFFPPTKAGMEKITVTANEGKLKLDVRFLSNDYLIISIPATVVFGSKPIPPSAPKKFKFAGIRHKFAMSMRSWDNRHKRKRSASSDSWSERHHPSGYWPKVPVDEARL
ncbi:unnamed protein product [Clonostachys rhizophaga]|uniref:Uncharacterized protein n=1 Tax=Clonostachys rhizophaga TaxID=160324 RepID=A0A9N9YKQ0_9HYPO|nr:unnamed protein product [Clonostachys rhizophaga]